MSRPRDVQKSKLYAWERTSVDRRLKKPLTTRQVHALVRKVFDTAGSGHAPPRTTVRNVQRGKGGRYYITMPAWALDNEAYVVHEATHAVMDLEGDRTAWHSPEFVRRYIDNLEDVLGRDRAELIASARAAGLRVAG